MDATAAPAASAAPTGGPPIPPRPLGRPRAVPKTSRGPYRKPLSLHQKVDIVRKIDAGATKSATAKRLGLNESTVRSIYKQRDKLLSTVKAAGAEGAAKRSRIWPEAKVRMEQLLEQYLRRQEARAIPISRQTTITRYLQRRQPDDDVEIIDVEEEEEVARDVQEVLEEAPDFEGFASSL